LLLDGALFLALLGVIISSLVIDNKDPNLLVWGLPRPSWVIVHIVSSVTMLVGSTLHLVWHWGWVQAVFARAARPRPKAVRRNRLVDLWLFGLSLLLAASGLLIWPLSGNLDEGNPLAAAPLLGMRGYDWKQLHAWGAVLMFGLLALHLALHWKWIVTTARRVLRLAPAKTGPATLAEE
ncbi:MAG: DUF4405 domain-containing protein, partial [Chloroflexales bacterium]|nr:DUF4405 domain-containing protein [Chloroflexales bacterium]